MSTVEQEFHLRVVILAIAAAIALATLGTVMQFWVY